MQHRLVPKIKKRFKRQQLSGLLEQKAGKREFDLGIKSLSERIEMVDHRFEVGVPPAMEQKL